MPDASLDAIAATVRDEKGSAIQLALAASPLEDVAYHDFLSFEFLIDPHDTKSLELEELSDDGAAFLDALESDGASLQTLEFVGEFLTGLETVVKRAFEHAIPTGRYSTPITAPIAISDPRLSAARVIRRLYVNERYVIWTLLDLYLKVPSFLEEHVYDAFVREAASIHKSYQMGVVAMSPWRHTPSGAEFSWAGMTFVPEDARYELPSALEYPFEVYPSKSVNFGIAVVYRQRWKPLGMQPGEVLKTVPLGPGQKEKVSTKITRRHKQSRNLETSRESETSTETTDTTKDSSEVVREAADSFKWNVSAEANYGGFGFGAKVSGGMEGSRSSSSKQTASNLSESMRKTASKMRQQTKVTVNTETEEAFEEERASEINNPNDELALTYVYQSLQHQYEVQTYLAEVRNVVFVAERVPAPIEIDANWVRKHDWVLARVLKDASYAQTLNELIQDADAEDLLPTETQNTYKSMVSKARDRFAEFTHSGAGGGQGGLSLPDIYSEPQRQLDAYLRDRAERKRANRLREVRRDRLYEHLRQNILYYCRAIWMEEDNDQRMLRYRKEGRTIPTVWKATLIDPADPLSEETALEPGEHRVPLEDVLDITGPIGFAGNYLVFPLRPLEPEQTAREIVTEEQGGAVVVTLPLQEVLDQVLRSAYSDGHGLRDPALPFFTSEAVEHIQRAEGSSESDPRQLLFRSPTDSEVFDFVSLMPEFTEKLLDGERVRRDPGGGGLTHPISAADWGAYLLRRNGTRRFLVDSNNLYVSIFVGDGRALEPFKRGHRYLDLLRAAEQLEAEKLRNQRRQTHLETAGEFDPDIAKVVIVSDSSSVAANAAAGGVAGGDDARRGRG